MPEAPMFWPGDPIVDCTDRHETGRVQYARADGMVLIRWHRGETEWVDSASIEFAPGFKPTRRHR
jgi:hypothetical protein